MRKIYKTTVLFLFISLLSGCSYQNYQKTIVLPVEASDEAAKTQPSDEDWSLKRIYQYQYSSNDLSFSNKEVFSSIGWSGNEHLLYTLDGRRGEDVIINRVDIRYGFYEECANLGPIDYNQMQLSPDGRYLLYDTYSEDKSQVLLNLYSISAQNTSQIAALPYPEPSLMLDYTWSGDSSTIFFYYVPKRLPKVIDKSSDKAVSEAASIDEKAFYSEEHGNLLVEVMSYNLNRGKTEYFCIENQEYENAEGFGLSLNKQVLSNVFGTKILATLPYNDNFFIADLSADKRLSMSYDYYSERGKEAPPFIFSQITDHYLCARDEYEEFNYFISLDYPDMKLSKISYMEGSDILLSNDESHLIQIEHYGDEESIIYLYTCVDNNPSTLSDKELLYQTKDDISDIFITPDDRHIIIRTQNQESLSTFVHEAESNGFALEDFLDKVSQAAEHKVTILEL